MAGRSISRVIEFTRTGLWRIRETDLPRTWALLLRLYRTVVLSVKGLVDDKCPLRASALTFYSLLSIVPIVAMIFGVAKGFGFEKTLERELLLQLEGQEEIVERVITFSHSLLETTKGGLVAGIGLLFLFWTIIKMISNIEAAFNTIWAVPSGRPIGRKVADYLSLMLICPLLFVLASALTVFAEGQIRAAAEHISLIGSLSPVIFKLFRLLPFAVIWVLFSFLYAFLPNTKVRPASAALGGFVGAAFYQIFQWIYITFQINVAKYNAIYGSFAALPLFLFWLQVSWLLVLFGAEITSAHQNARASEFGPDCRNMSFSFRRLLALAITRLLALHFSDEDNRWDETRIAVELETPVRCVRLVLRDLLDADVIASQNAVGKGPVTYQPARDPDVLTVSYVMGRLEQNGSSDIPLVQSPDTEKLAGLLKHLRDQLAGSENDVSLKRL